MPVVPAAGRIKDLKRLFDEDLRLFMDLAVASLSGWIEQSFHAFVSV